MASNPVESSSFPRDLDVLMIDPVLDYINQILMDEDVDDATQLQQADGTSNNYQAIFSSLQDIIGGSTTDDQLHKTTGAPPPGEFLPASGHPQSNFREESPCLQVDLCENKIAGRYNLHFNADAAARNRRHSIQKESTDGVLPTDARVSYSSKDDAVVEGLRGQTGQGHGSAMSKLPSAHERISSNVAEVEPSFRDLKLDDVYTSLYVNEPRSSANIAAGSHKLNEYKKNSMAVGKRRFRDTHTSEALAFVDVSEVLISCAQAVAIGDARGANEILQELHRVYGASAHGTGLQRMAYAFSRALAARMRGTGVQEAAAMSRDAPSSAAVLRASKVKFGVSPSQKIVHYFANQSILKAAEGASRLHIVDYGLMHGVQWPCLIIALADRKGGPPLLVITGIEFPQPGTDMAKKLDESGRRLAAYAKSHNVPFQYHAIVTDKWEDLDAGSVLCSEGEVLVVNCICKRLRHLADDTAPSASTSCTRQKLLTVWHSLNPHLLITAVLNAALNSPFFLSRFRETLYFFSNVFDLLDTVWGNIPETLTIERSFFYRDIMNIVACEGIERVDRPENYKQWYAHITKAGFEQLPIPSTILARSKLHVKQHYHKDFLIHEDEKGWMLMGWKGRALIAISAWKPRHVS